MRRCAPLPRACARGRWRHRHSPPVPHAIHQHRHRLPAHHRVFAQRVARGAADFEVGGLLLPAFLRAAAARAGVLARHVFCTVVGPPSALRLLSWTDCWLRGTWLSGSKRSQWSARGRNPSRPSLRRARAPAKACARAFPRPRARCATAGRGGFPPPGIAPPPGRPAPARRARAARRDCPRSRCSAAASPAPRSRPGAAPPARPRGRAVRGPCMVSTTEASASPRSRVNASRRGSTRCTRAPRTPASADRSADLALQRAQPVHILLEGRGGQRFHRGRRSRSRPNRPAAGLRAQSVRRRRGNLVLGCEDAAAAGLDAVRHARRVPAPPPPGPRHAGPGRRRAAPSAARSRAARATQAAP